ncbi:hypothetical protein [Marinomonas polaris]|uniref:hypothetical protein n=1 Tax=Marinomonas polaris TaxID=293552 RepID=UPI003F9715DC
MREISKARFEALSYARAPLVKFFSEEVAWFSSDNDAVLASILFEKIDKDFVVIILGRDEVGVFRWIGGEISFPTILQARIFLEKEMGELALDGKEEFHQGVTKRKKNIIFEPIVSESSMCEDYKLVANSELFLPAKELIKEIAYSFEDPDGNYIEQFQSTGFNSRLWELYLYAFFHESDFEINREFNSPDYVIEKGGKRICVEAVTVNPSQSAINEDEPTTDKQKEGLLKDYMPIRYGSPLFSKLKKEYWKKEHVSGHPLLIAIHDYHQPNSMMWSRPALETYLYGATSHIVNNGDIYSEKTTRVSTHKWKGKEIPSGFFEQPDSENISAVIHSNQATIGKFLRMGYLAEFGGDETEIAVSCEAIFSDSPISEKINLEVIRGKYEEYWHQSVIIYHNPNANNPLPLELFPNVAHMTFLNGEFMRSMPFYFPLKIWTHYNKRE